MVEIKVVNGKTQIVVSFSALEVESAEEAEALLAFTCSKDKEGNYTACELEQGSKKFQQRLTDAYAVMKSKPRRK